MADICRSEIRVIATESEWNEIVSALKNGQVEWPPTLEGPYFDDLLREITFENRNHPRPKTEGQMQELSRSYPSAVFHYCASYESGSPSEDDWFCGDKQGRENDVADLRKKSYAAEVERFAKAKTASASGVMHSVQLLSDGRVEAKGKNRFGECDTSSWTDIAEISCGNWHTVGLRKDGTLVACGSNVNGQCDVTDLKAKAVGVSCGRYHTAVLLEDGSVLVKGTLEHEADIKKEEPDMPYIKTEDFPVVYKLSLNMFTKDWQKKNELIEHISVGDELILDGDLNKDNYAFGVLNSDGEELGIIMSKYGIIPSSIVKNIRATVDTVKPLSKMRKGSKYASMTVRLDYDDTIRMQESAQEDGYQQANVSVWPPVTRIKSVYDAVIGLTGNNNMFADGFFPDTGDNTLNLSLKKKKLTVNLI